MSVLWWVLGIAALLGLGAALAFRKPEGGAVSSGVADKAKEWDRK